MYDELIKRLRECTAEQNGEKTLWHQAADAIEELWKLFQSAEKDNAKLTAWYVEKCNKHKWIPVTERLPQEQKTVLIWGKQGVILLDWRHDNKWCCFRDITHWMPLPQPPESEDEEDGET